MLARDFVLQPRLVFDSRSIFPLHEAGWLIYVQSYVWLAAELFRNKRVTYSQSHERSSRLSETPAMGFVFVLLLILTSNTGSVAD